MTEEELEKDLQVVENAEKERERMLLRGLIKKQGTEINKLKQENEQLKSELGYTRRLNYTGNHIPQID